jgi:hypothetical protein
MILASSFSNAFFGGVATFAFLSVDLTLVWAAVIAWGCFFHVGGDFNAVRVTITGNCLGILAGWIIGLLLTADPGLGLPVWGGLAVFTVVIVMVFIGHQIGLHLKMTIVVIPASFYGVAATVAYMTQTPGMLTTQVLLSASIENPLIVMPISMAIGAFLGLATATMTKALGTPSKSTS